MVRCGEKELFVFAIHNRFYDASLKDGLRRYHKSSLQEYAPAQYNYALMHETGQHVEKSYPTALKWYRKAANHGDPDAQVHKQQTFR